MDQLLDRFRREERIDCVLEQAPGALAAGELAYSTALSYSTYLERYIRPRWGKTRIENVRPMAIQEWLNNLDRAPKTKGHIRSLLYRIFSKAELWELTGTPNPVRLVEIRGVSKRLRRKPVLTVRQVHAIVSQLPVPYCHMVRVAQATGLRASEVLGLQWRDVQWKRRTLSVTRAVVHGRTKNLKTECSADDLPLDKRLLRLLRAWKKKCPASTAGWIFPSPVDPHRGKPFHASPIQQDYFRPAGKKIGIDRLGWAHFRHSFRAWLDAVGTPLGAQKSLMRHTNISTTMNVYGAALMKSKRAAQARVATMMWGGKGMQGLLRRHLAGGRTDGLK
jgi:integrase